MADKTTGTKCAKPLSIVAGVLLLLLIGITGVEWWLESKARRMIEQESKGLRVEIGSVNVNLLNREIRLRDLDVRSDSGALLLGDSSLRSLHVTLSELTASGIGFRNRNGERALQMQNLQLTSPRIVIERNKPGTAKAPADTSSAAVGLRIARLELTDGEVEYHLHQNGQVNTCTLSGLSIEGKKLNVDSLASGTMTGQKLRVSADRIGYAYNGRAFLAEADTVTVDAAEGTFSVASVRLTPQYEKDEFAERAKSDWTQASAGPLTGFGVDYAAMLAEKRVAMDSLRIGGGSVASYKNRQVWQKDRVKPLFSQTLQRLPFGLSVGRIEVGPVDVTYEELAVGGLKPGMVTFTGLSATFDGLTNIPAAEPFYTMTARGKLMGQAPVNLTVDFPVDSLTNRFEVRGHVGAFDLTAMSRALEPLMEVEIESGKLNSLDFRIAGSMTRSQVEMTMLYEQFSLCVLKPKDGRYKERKGVSFFVDSFLVKNNNPDSRGKVRTGTGSFDRNPYRSQYNYLWKSLLPGIKKTVL